MKTLAALLVVAIPLLGACTQSGDTPAPQTSAASVAAAAMPAPQSSGSIQVFDFMAPGNRRTVSPNWATINAQLLGSKGNPVRALMPQGQQAYLNRLICPDGKTPSFRRIGNFGVGVYTTIIDGYDVRCGSSNYTVYLDMYHPNYIEQRPVPGFTIRPAGATS